MGFINKNFNLADCLKPTKMCDSAHPFIIQKAQSLTKMVDTNEEKAKAIFYYIRDSIEFFYPRLASKGIMVFDDYGCVQFPGAKKAVDECIAGYDRAFFLPLPSGQAFLIKDY